MKQKESRPNAYRRGYATKRYQRMRRAFIRQKVVETGDGRCAICGETLLNIPDRDITIDHIIPPLRFGPYGSAEYFEAFYDTDNWQIAHRKCNSAKQDREGGGSIAGSL